MKNSIFWQQQMCVYQLNMEHVFIWVILYLNNT